ncbi:MAG: hypothetical protein ACXU9M_14295, partial [Thermodesulfobacteriota bacterium]
FRGLIHLRRRPRALPVSLLFPLRKILPVLLKEDAFVFPPGGWRNIIIMFLQPIEDFFAGLVIRLSAFRVKFGQYLV